MIVISRRPIVASMFRFRLYPSLALFLQSRKRNNLLLSRYHDRPNLVTLADHNLCDIIGILFGRTISAAESHFNHRLNKLFRLDNVSQDTASSTGAESLAVRLPLPRDLMIRKLNAVDKTLHSVRRLLSYVRHETSASCIRYVRKPSAPTMLCSTTYDSAS